MSLNNTTTERFNYPSLSLSKWRPTLKNRRGRTILIIVISFLFLAVIIGSAAITGSGATETNLEDRNISPCLQHLFGTDWLGRDMLQRTLSGLSLSLRTGLLAAGISGLVSLVLGIAAGIFGGNIDRFITWLVDVFLSLPHMVALILISFAMGGGLHGVVIAIAVTHWPRLTRVLRAEVMEIREKEYIKISGKLGHSQWFVARHHVLPHIIPQFMIGTILMFPHAILHEAGLTFVGIGLSPHDPAIGVILSESMRYLTAGYWWLAVMPGLSLLIVVLAFDAFGGGIRALLNPKTSQE